MYDIANELDLEEIDNFSEKIDDMLSDIGEDGFKQNEIIDFSEEFTGDNMYQIFLNRKKELIQEKLDDYSTVEDEIYNLDESLDEPFDRDVYIDELSNSFLDILNYEINQSYFENDLNIDDFDDNIWNDNIYDVVDEFKSFEIDKNYIEEYTYKKINNDDIKSILDRPL